MAATALGLTTAQAYRYVLLPMAFRIIMPPLTSEFLNTIKNTSVAITIGLIELTGEARSMQEFSFQVFEAFTAATVLYLADQYRRRHRHALARARPGGPRLHHREIAHHVRQFRFRRHPPLAGLPVLRRHDVHADADRPFRGRRPDVRHADRADAAVGLQAARPHRRALCRPDALAAAGAGDLLVLFPGALYRAMADRIVAADPRRRVHLLAGHLHHVRGGVFLRDHARRHPVDLEGTAGRGAGARPDL